MGFGNYILDDDGNPKLERDTLKWAQWFETCDRIVQQDHIGDAFVSTVFLGLDHNYSNEGPPVLWETMIFQGGKDVTLPSGRVLHLKEEQWMDRYTSKDDAIAGHMRACELVKQSQRDLIELERMAEAGGWTKK